MSVKQRFKLGAGAGLVTMLLGALMVLAPGAGADHTTPVPTIYGSNVQCQGTGQGNVVGLGYDDSVEFGSVFVGDTEGVSFTSTIVDGVRHFEWASTTHNIGAVVVKQGNGAAVFSYEPTGATSGTVYVATSSDLTNISHISFCFGGTPVEPEFGGISVDKSVVGNDQPPANTLFSFTVDCSFNEEAVDLNGGDAGTQASFSLTAGDAPKAFSGIPAGAVCTVVETGGPLADAVSITVDAGAPTAGSTVSGVTINADATRVVVVTNEYNSTPPPPPPGPDLTPEEPEPVASLQVIKVADALDPDDIPEGWAVDFEVGDSDGGVVREILLSDGSGVSSAEELEPGTYTITEIVDDGSELTDVSCVGGEVTGTDLAGGSVTVALDDGDEAVCVFTNFYTAVSVLPIIEEPEPTEEEPAVVPTVEPTEEVLGVQTTRTLPRTGGETRGLAGAGALMLALGTAMVLGSRRQLARR